MTTKIAVSLPDEQVIAAKEAVAQGRSPSVSAYIAESVQRREREDGLQAVLDEMDRELGPPSAEDYAWAEKMLGAC